jgi:hypothetical protein
MPTTRFIVPDERLPEFRDIIINLTKQTLKPDEKNRKQPVRSVNKNKLLVLKNKNLNTKRLEQTKKKKVKNTVINIFKKCGNDVIVSYKLKRTHVSSLHNQYRH